MLIVSLLVYVVKKNKGTFSNGCQFISNFKLQNEVSVEIGVISGLCWMKCDFCVSKCSRRPGAHDLYRRLCSLSWFPGLHSPSQRNLTSSWKREPIRLGEWCLCKWLYLEILWWREARKLNFPPHLYISELFSLQINGTENRSASSGCHSYSGTPSALCWFL